MLLGLFRALLFIPMPHITGALFVSPFGTTARDYPSFSLFAMTTIGYGALAVEARMPIVWIGVLGAVSGPRLLGAVAGLPKIRRQRA